MSERLKASCLLGDCVATTCSFSKQAYRHNEAILLLSRTRLSKHSNIIALMEFDRMSFVFFAPSGDVGL